MNQTREQTVADGNTDRLPQFWEVEGITREQYLARALEQEKNGGRLVVETWYNGYPDPMGEGDTWFVDWLDYSDWHTGKHFCGFDPDTDPEGATAGLVVVERRLVND